MNLWQVWLTPSETRNRSLSVVRVSTISVVADSNGDMVGSHLVADLSRGLNDSLDNRDVSHSTNGGKGMDSRGNHWGMSVWEGAKNHSRVSLSVPLDNGVGKGKSVAKTMVAKTGITQSSNSGSGNNRGMMDHWEDRGVVDERGGGRDDPGAPGEDGRVGLPLAVVAVAVAEVAIAVGGNGDGVGGHLVGGHGGGLNDSLDHGVVGHGTVGSTDEGGRGDSGVGEGGGMAQDDGRVCLGGGRGRREYCLGGEA